MSTPGQIVARAVVAGLFAANAAALGAQHPTDDIEWNIENLRPRGQAVIPIYDGWYPKPDGTFDLCFGYYNLNLEEVLDIPVGPDNFIEPARFNGKQPTHFMVVPPPPNLYRRYFCVFTVNVPANFGKNRVVWTLKLRGRSYSVPGHMASKNYQLPEITAAASGRASVAPVVKFEPTGPEGRGKSGVWANRTASVGKPLDLQISVPPPPKGTELDAVSMDDPDDSPAAGDKGPKRIWWVFWAQHQGPGSVAFEPQASDVLPGDDKVSTKATFSEPGEYVLRVQAIDDPTENGSYEYHCCWTNGYVKVTVTK